jgi:LysR family cys regulon transcriptional activator
MRFQQLQGFCETARQRSFTAAAAVLRLSPPALWHQIRALEREIATGLIQRKGRGVELTDDGRLLLELVEPLVNGFASIRTVFAERKGAVQRRLCVASTPALLASQLRSVVYRFRECFPRVRLTLLDRASQEVLTLVENGEADLGIASLFHEKRDYPLLEYESLFAEPFVLICPADHELARQRVVRLESLTRYPFVLMTPGTLPRHRVERVFREHGLWDRLNVVMETTNNALVVDYVLLGLGISVISGSPDEGPLQALFASMATQPGRANAGKPGLAPAQGLHVRRMTRWFGEETIALVWRKGAYYSEHVRSFRELVRQALTRGRGT